MCGSFSFWTGVHTHKSSAGGSWDPRRGEWLFQAVPLKSPVDVSGLVSGRLSTGSFHAGALPVCQCRELLVEGALRERRKSVCGKQVHVLWTRLSHVARLPGKGSGKCIHRVPGRKGKSTS